ncbi:MAG: L,D-transpeptidase [Vicinamibacterales bacterium]
MSTPLIAARLADRVRRVAVAARSTAVARAPVLWAHVASGMARHGAVAVGFAGALLVLAALFAGTGIDYVDVPLGAAGPRLVAASATSSAAAPKELRELRGRDQKLRARIQATMPKGRFIVIDQTQNRLYVKEKDRTLVEAVCSAGSGMVLKEGSGGRTWVFDTPRGQFRVLSKISNPVWRKPDWAFVEEGKPIPRDPGERLEYGTLGEYALYFGNGFMIHGTLYERLLGRSVSHGCIRLGREDLRKVYAAAPIGTPIFIY